MRNRIAFMLFLALIFVPTWRASVAQSDPAESFQTATLQVFAGENAGFESTNLSCGTGNCGCDCHGADLSVGFRITHGGDCGYLLIQNSTKCATHVDNDENKAGNPADIDKPHSHTEIRCSHYQPHTGDRYCCRYVDGIKKECYWGG